jgi:heme-degrading monooxygenase HmoA
MILETAFISVKPGRVAEFLAVLPDARKVLEQATGFLELTVQVGVERENTVLLSILWQTLEDHTVSFRGGELFPQWREIIGPFFDSPPVVEHWEVQNQAARPNCC